MAAQRSSGVPILESIKNSTGQDSKLRNSRFETRCIPEVLPHLNYSIIITHVFLKKFNCPIANEEFVFVTEN